MLINSLILSMMLAFASSSGREGGDLAMMFLRALAKVAQHAAAGLNLKSVSATCFRTALQHCTYTRHQQSSRSGVSGWRHTPRRTCPRPTRRTLQEKIQHLMIPPTQDGKKRCARRRFVAANRVQAASGMFRYLWYDHPNVGMANTYIPCGHCPCSLSEAGNRSGTASSALTFCPDPSSASDNCLNKPQMDGEENKVGE